MRKVPTDVAAWYIEPIGEYTNGVVSGISTETAVFWVEGKDIRCWAVTYIELVSLEESRKTDNRFRFSVWYKTRLGLLELWKSDYSYTHHKPNRKLRNSLTNGEGKPVNFPRKRKPGKT